MGIKYKQIEPSRRVLIALAHYKHNESIHQFLKHLSSLQIPPNWALEVLVCDNSDDFEDTSDLNINITAYRPGENKYYFGGCWYALEKWKESNAVFPEWVIVANHDLVFESDFFMRLLTMPIDEDVAVIAPDVKLPNGIKQNPHLLVRPSYISIVIRTIAFRYRSIYNILNLRYQIKMYLKSLANAIAAKKADNSAASQAKIEKIYSTHGCIFLFRNIFFERGGSLASNAMMYHEEFLVAERCRQMGLHIIMDPKLHVVHNENTVIKLVPSSIQNTWLKSLSHVLIDIYKTGEKDVWKLN